MSQPDYIETQLDRMEAKLDQLLARPSGGGTTPPVEPPTVPSVRYPADVFGTGWKLTLPINGAQEVKQPALATYTSKYCELNTVGEVVFRAWHGGDTTSGSKNPRSELREMKSVGAEQAAWSSTSGRHRMVVEGKVTRLTKVKPEVVVAQIHDAEDDVTVFRLEGSKLWITAGDTTHGYLVDANLALGQDYTVGFDVTGGMVSFTYNGAPVPFKLKPAKTNGWYFKTGNYLQSNLTTAPSESTAEYAEVVLRSVSVTHS